MRGFRFWSAQETRGLTAALLGVLGLTIGYRCAFFACFFISHNCVISSWPERRMRRNMCSWVFWSAHSLTCSWFVLRRPVLLFTLPFGGGNGYKLFISPSASALPLTFLLYVKPPYVFVITPQRTPPTPTPPSFISHIHQAVRWSVGLVITTSYLLVIICQAQSYKHPMENNGRALPQPGMTLLSCLRLLWV